MIIRTLIWLLFLATVPAFSQNMGRINPETQAEALAVCSVIESEPLTPYGFGMGTLISLSYARDAAARGDEIKQVAKESDNMFSLITGLMRVTKMSTNDFLCAKHSLRPFIGKGSNENTKLAAEYLMVVYDSHIAIDNQMIDLYKHMDNLGPDLMDKISTLQVERGQRWADLVKPTSLALLMMVDGKNTDVPGKTTRLAITKDEKKTRLAFIEDHFPEFKNGTPRDQWADPAKTAQMYFTIFEGRKCSDE